MEELVEVLKGWIRCYCMLKINACHREIEAVCQGSMWALHDSSGC